MVLDAGKYYQEVAPYAGYGQGYFLAALVEVFLAVTITIRLKNSFFGNVLVNFLTVFLFIQAVSVSALQTALPAWQEISRIEASERLAATLAGGLEQEAANARYMRQNRQHANLALTARAQRSERRQLAKTLSNIQSDLEYWLRLLSALLLKLTLQSVNLFMFWYAGRLQREAADETIVDTPVEAATLAGPMNTAQEPVEPHPVTDLRSLIRDLKLTPTRIAVALDLSRPAVSAVVNHYAKVVQYLQDYDIGGVEAAQEIGRASCRERV